MITKTKFDYLDVMDLLLNGWLLYVLVVAEGQSLMAFLSQQSAQ